VRRVQVSLPKRPSSRSTCLTSTALSALLSLILFIAGCGNDKNYRLVSEKYNFSVEFPERPTEEAKTNDEGLPKSYWQVSREKIVAKDYFTAEATSYKEIPNEALLALNGVKMLEHHRFKLKAKETGREVDAMQTVSREQASGSTISSIYVVDAHNMISVTARMNDNPGKAALFLASFTILR
jgi:hypothetical protein